MYTDTVDWLTDYFSKYSHYFYISGHESLSISFDIPDSIIHFIFYGNKKGIFAYILSIDVSSVNREVVKAKIMKHSLLDKISSIFGKIHIVLYDKQNNFSVFVSSKFVDMNSSSLEKYFSKVNSILTRNKGTIKDVNISINNYFQAWGRKHLSKYIVQNDIDVFTIKTPSIFELKRVQQDTAEWMPYLDDKANYRCLKKICYQNKMDFKILAYRQDREMEVAYHKIQKIDDDKIYGMFTLCSPKEVYKDVEDFKDIIRYESRNRRQY